jgi:hypothetical protein
MKALSKRLAKLEVRSAPDRDPQGRTVADVLRERRCRRLAQDRNVPYEKVLQERLAEDRAFWAGYTGPRTIADVLRYGRQHRVTASAAGLGLSRDV